MKDLNKNSSYTKEYVYVVVQFYPWFNFNFLLYQTRYHILPYPQTKQNPQTKETQYI